MAVDMLRSCSVQLAEVGREPGTQSNLRWFLCADGAKVFPGWNAFASPVWEPFPDDWKKGPGIFSPLLNWSKNHIPCPPGLEFHGEEDWFENGIPSEVLANPDAYKRPLCPGFAVRGEISAVGSPVAYQVRSQVAGVGIASGDRMFH